MMEPTGTSDPRVMDTYPDECLCLPDEPCDGGCFYCHHANEDRPCPATWEAE